MLLFAEIRNRRLQFEALQHLIQLLPVPNRDTLCALLNFLVTVARNCDDHKDDSGMFFPRSLYKPDIVNMRHNDRVLFGR